jgi:hypothetical protein
MQLKDFPSFLRTTDRDDPMEHSADATAIIYNTFDELEQPALDALPRPAYTVAPLNLLAEQLVPAGCPLDALGSNLWKEDRACLDWLDGVKEPRSVVYVNYGSITVMSNQQLVEFAWGLANSGYAFLWVVRPDLVKGDAAVLPPEFLEATRGRGRWRAGARRRRCCGTALSGCSSRTAGGTPRWRASPAGCPCCRGPSSPSSRRIRCTIAWSGAWRWTSATTCDVRWSRAGSGRPWPGRRGGR